MRILLLQDHIYLPSYGGGVKANRMLLEGLARLGHRCAAVTPAFAPSAGPTGEAEFREEMSRRGIEVREGSPSVFSYRFRGVDVDALSVPATADVVRRVRDLRPDWVLVNDDKLRLLLHSALTAAGPERVVLVLQTITNTPFGPLSLAPSPEQAQWMRRARAIVVISGFLQRYLTRYGGLESTVLRLPVYGDGPWPLAGDSERRFVTIVNPCLEKGGDVFLALSREFPDVEFAAVRGWGTDGAVSTALDAQPNVHVLDPSDDLDEVLGRTRVLLAPSLWPETFGYIVPEAMLRGIPVLASDVGGLPEAGLGAATLVPVAPLERQNGHYLRRVQDIGPWRAALRRLLADETEYERRSKDAREAALRFVSEAGADRFERFLDGLGVSR
jgi:glycosyltransferase involved in cell wall biosynthesis